MADVTLSSKNQITIPVGMVRSLGLQAGDKLIVIDVGDHLALFPKPADFADYIVGSMKGFWGTKEDIDRYVSDLRASPERDEAREEVEDLLAVDDVARSVVYALSAAPHHVATLADLASPVTAPLERMVRETARIPTAKLDAAVALLVRLGAVRGVQAPDDKAPRYRLVSEFVRPRRGASSR